MATAVTFTLSVYNAAGTSVEFAVSSVVGDTLPHLTSEPIGDGQEFDPLTGETRAGQYTGRIADAITSGTDRVITSRLEDANFRQQLMRRKAILKKTTGGSDVVLCAGLLTRLALVGVAEYEYEVTDRTRIRRGVKLFAPRTGTVILTAGAVSGATTLACQALPIALPKNTMLNFGAGKIHVVATTAAASATSITTTGKGADGSTNALAVSNGDQANYREGISDFLSRWPTRGCVFGGPILGDGFMGVPNKGGWVFRLQRWPNGATGPFLRFLQGYGPPDFNKWLTDINDLALAKATNDRVGPWNARGGVDATGAKMLVPGPLTTFDQAERSGFAKDLVVEILSEYAATSYGYYQPSIFVLTAGEAAPSLVDVGRAAGGGLPAYDAGVWLTPMNSTQYTASGLPAHLTTVRARAFTVGLSELSPLYLDDHPVNIIGTALTELGYTYDSASATTTTETIGSDIRWRDRIVASPDAGEYIAQLQAAFGIGLRPQDDGDLEFFASRIFSNSPPSVEITAADVVDPDEIGPGPVFEISEQTAIKKVVVEFNSITAAPFNSAERPPDGIVVQPVRIERTNGDPGAVGDRVHTWTLTGMVSRLSSQKPDLTYFDVPIREVFDRWGRGVIECSLALLRGGSADAAKLGDEVIVTLPQLPNKKKRYGDDNSVGGRAMQIVRLTQQVWGALAKLIDSGPNAQPYGTAPTISIATSSDYPKTVADLTITNAGTLNAAGAGARVQMAVTTGGAPVSGAYSDVMLFPPGQIPTAAFPLPDVIAGRRVYAKVRAEIPASNRPSSYSSASNVTLSSYTAPSGVSVSADSSDGTKATISWTVGESTLRTDVFFRVTSGSSASDDVLVESLQPGANRFTLSMLKPSTGYTITVQHRDPISGDVSAKATGTVTTDADVAALPAPQGVRGFVGVQDASFGIPTDRSSFGIAGSSNLVPMDLEAYSALETGVGAGTYGDFYFMGRVAARQATITAIASRAPGDGLRRQIKMRQLPTGRHPGLASMMTHEVAALSVAEAAAMDAWGLAGSFSSVVTVTPYTNTSIQTNTKTIRIAGADFQGTNATFDAGETRALFGTAPTARAPLRVPTGAILTGWRMRTYLGDVAGVINVTITKAASGSETGIDNDSRSGSSSGYATSSTQVISETVDNTAFYYYAETTIDATGLANARDARLSYVEIEYTAPALDVS